MRRSAGASLAAIGLAATGLAGAAHAQASALSFDGASLGVSLADWRALALPDGVAPGARPLCSNDPSILASGSAALTPARNEAGDVVCAYGRVYGRYVFTDPAPMVGGHWKTDARYVFARGRLAQIDFTTSVDAFSDVVALFTNAYGPPRSTTRDRVRSRIGWLPRVRMTWAAPGGEVRLVDPTADDSRLGVSLTGAAAAGVAVGTGGGPARG